MKAGTAIEGRGIEVIESEEVDQVGETVKQEEMEDALPDIIEHGNVPALVMGEAEVVKPEIETEEIVSKEIITADLA